MQFDKEILKGYIDSIVLSVMQSSDMYGYEIAKSIREKTEDKFEMKEATLYVSLKRLEKKNYLMGYWNDDKGTGGGRRRYYSITEEGKEYFKDKVEEWVLLKSLLNNFMEVIFDE